MLRPLLNRHWCLEIAHSSCLKMLGVSIKNNFSIAQHVQLSLIHI